MRKNYGMPYQGSKNRIAEDIIDFLPKRKVLVDLFGGGGAISDCASQSQKFDKIIYNELNPLIADTFQKAINGEYENERRWISHEEFDQLKDKDGYVAICFSFSNSCDHYMYGRKIEPYKRAYHYAIVFDDFEPFRELFDDETTEKIKKSVEGIIDLKKRRIKFSHALGDYTLSLERLPSQESYERLKILLSEDIEVLNKDYADVELPSPENCVIYCDIPYDKTYSYVTGCFDYERFYKWCQEKTSEGYQIYVSSYELPEDLFTEVWSKQKYRKANNSVGKHVVEKIYTVRK